MLGLRESALRDRELRLELLDLNDQLGDRADVDDCPLRLSRRASGNRDA
jgi:hypothetical protein